MFGLIADQIEGLFYLTLPFFYIIGMVATIAGIPFFIYFYKRKIPKAAKTIFWASIRREPPLILCHDSGRGEFTTIHERKGEGIVMTAQGKYKILPRYLPRLPLSTITQQNAAVASSSKNVATESDSPEDEEETSVAPTEALPKAVSDGSGVVDLHQAFSVKVLKEYFIFDYSSFIQKRTNLVGLDLPLWIGYTGKLCLLNPEALALYEAGDMMIHTEDGTLFNPNKVEGKKIEDALQPLLLMDPRKIQQIIYSGFDQSQIAGVVSDSEELARIGQGMSSKLKMLIIILVIGIVAVLALLFLPSMFKAPSSNASFILSCFKNLVRFSVRR
jgi:hypothetical protein